jgi:hypothetical protein
VVDCRLDWVPGFVRRPDSLEHSEGRALGEDLALGYPNHPNHLPSKVLVGPWEQVLKFGHLVESVEYETEEGSVLIIK